VNDVRQETAEATAKALGAGARAIAADVADSKAVAAMFAIVEREHGRLDVLVNNAGVAMGPGDDRAALMRKGEARIHGDGERPGRADTVGRHAEPVRRGVAPRDRRAPARHLLLHARGRSR